MKPIGPKTDEKKSLDAKRSSFRDPIVLSTIVIAVATAVSGGIGYLQYLTLNKTDGTSRAGERAFVFVRHEGSTWTPAKEIGGRIIRSFHVEWENNGNTQTKDLTLALYCPPVQPFAVPNPVTQLEFATLSQTRLLGPKQNTWGGVCNYTVDQLNLVKDSGYHLYIGAEADYYDIFGDHHVTKFCNEIVAISGKMEDLSVNPQGETEQCGQNCADEECQKKQ